MSDDVKSLDELLEASAAHPDFKQAVRALEQGDASSERVAFNPEAPPVKVLRTIMKLLESHPDEPIESVSIQAHSGCSDFTGVVTVEPGAGKFEFNWDCRWKAEQMGWNDPLGMPDQIRAARTFGYQCFERFEAVD